MALQQLVLLALVAVATAGRLPRECKHYVAPNLYDADLASLLLGQRCDAFSAVDLVKAYTRRIDEVNIVNAALHAVIDVGPKALQQAAALDAERKRGKPMRPLHGLPVLLKDNIVTLTSEGMASTAGSFSLVHGNVTYEGELVRKLRRAGAIILGKANMDEFAGARGDLNSGFSPRGGQTRDPYSRMASPGGSSGGSAVASGIGLAAFTIGTDTSSSIINPSEASHIFGLRPTVGRVSRHGVIPWTPRRDSPGPMTRSAADLALVLQVIAGPEAADPFTLAAPKRIPDFVAEARRPLHGMRLGVPPSGVLNEMDRGPVASIALDSGYRKALKTIQHLGAVLVPIAANDSDFKAYAEFANLYDHTLIGDRDGPDSRAALNAYLATLHGSPMRSLDDIVDYIIANPELESPKKALDSDKGPYGLVGWQRAVPLNSSQYRAAVEQIDAFKTNYTGLFATHRLAGIALPPRADYALISATAFGAPVVSIPIGALPTAAAAKLDGQLYSVAPFRPFGLRIAGAHWGEADLLRIAAAYDAAVDPRAYLKPYPGALPCSQIAHVQRGRTCAMPKVVEPVVCTVC